MTRKYKFGRSAGKFIINMTNFIDVATCLLICNTGSFMLTFTSCSIRTHTRYQNVHNKRERPPRNLFTLLYVDNITKCFASNVSSENRQKGYLAKKNRVQM